MTTAAELIEYLQSLPPETDIGVVGGRQGDYNLFEELELPAKKKDGKYWWSTQNVDYGGDDGNGVPWLFLGRSS
jgi:hypothetical protein